MLSLFVGVVVVPLGSIVVAGPSLMAVGDSAALRVGVEAMAQVETKDATRVPPKDQSKNQAKPDQTQERASGGANDGESANVVPSAQHVPRHDIQPIDEIPDICWEEIRKQRVYFAHGPVGKELIAGLHTILDERPSIGLKILPYGEAPSKTQAGGAVSPPPFGTPAIVEGPIGADGDPMSKIDRFVAKLRSKEGQDVDVAVLLLSAEDFTRETNVESLHQHYVDSMRSLAGERPNLRIVHSTVPLSVPDRGMSARIKKFVGRGADQINAQRGRFNDLLRAEFGRKAIFDIAHAESESMDGRACSVRVGNVRWPAMTPEHADDRGQINDQGRIAIAREFVTALARPCVEMHVPKEAEVTVVPGTGGSD